MTMVVIGYDRYNVIVKGFSGVKITAGKVIHHLQNRRRKELHNFGSGSDSSGSELDVYTIGRFKNVTNCITNKSWPAL
jgi:hypothetical protein